MARIRILQAVVLIGFVSISAEAQENRYMVFFKDKQGVPFSTSEPIEFLSEKAIDRRLKQGIDISENDLPVNASYVQGVRNAGADVFFTTRWLNGLLIQCDPSIVPAVASLAYVERVEFVAPLPKLQSGGRRSLNQRKQTNHMGFETENQLQMIGIDRMHQGDYKGQGVVIAILDSGFPGVNSAPAFQHIISDGRFM